MKNIFYYKFYNFILNRNNKQEGFTIPELIISGFVSLIVLLAGFSLLRMNLQINKSDDPEKERQRLTDDYQKTFANPYRAAELGYVDEVIEPSLTRIRIIQALDSLKNKRDYIPAKRHGNIPL